MACAAAAQTYEECHVSRGGAIARERAVPGRRRLLPNATAAEAGRRRLLPKPITKEPGPKPAGSVTFLVVSRARSGTDWLRAMLKRPSPCLHGRRGGERHTNNEDEAAA